MSTLREFYEQKEKSDIESAIRGARYLDENTKGEMLSRLFYEQSETSLTDVEEKRMKKRALDLLEYYRDILVGLGFSMDRLNRSRRQKEKLPSISDKGMNLTTSDHFFKITGSYKKGKRFIDLEAILDKQRRDIIIYIIDARSHYSEIVKDERNIISFMEKMKINPKHLEY